MHEHVFILDPGALASFGTHFGGSYWNEEAGVVEAVAQLRRLRGAGIESIVDPTAYGLGRDIRRIQRLNDDVDLNIVVASGVYAFVELPGFLGYRTNDWIVDFFVHELREGIGETGVKASFLKCAIDRHGLVGDVPRIVFDYLRAIAETGASLGCDRFNIEHFNPDEDRIRTLIALVDAGYVDRIHLDHDAATFHDFMVGNPLFADEHPDYLHLSTQIFPRLLAAGLTQQHLDENPRRFFA